MEQQTLKFTSVEEIKKSVMANIQFINDEPQEGLYFKNIELFIKNNLETIKNAIENIVLAFWERIVEDLNTERKLIRISTEVHVDNLSIHLEISFEYNEVSAKAKLKSIEEKMQQRNEMIKIFGIEDKNSQPDIPDIKEYTTSNLSHKLGIKPLEIFPTLISTDPKSVDTWGDG